MIIDDDGLGILEVDCECVFELFVWFELLLRYYGVGFGLVFVSCIVCWLNGEVFVMESEGGGCWMCFVFFVYDVVERNG